MKNNLEEIDYIEKMLNCYWLLGCRNINPIDRVREDATSIQNRLKKDND